MKGFTLFTALVSLIFIGMTFLVIVHMDNNTAAYSSIINAITTQAEMESVKDYLRLEAINIFTILLRAKAFDYFSVTCEEGLEELRTEGGEIDFETLKEKCSMLASLILSNEDNIETIKMNKIENGLFFTTCVPSANNNCENTPNPFASYIGPQISTVLYDFQGTFRNKYFYRLYDPIMYTGDKNQNLFNPNFTPTVTEYTLTKILAKTFYKTKSEGSFLTFVDCTQNDCNVGTFYVKANFADIDLNTYVKLPRLLLYRVDTFSALDDAIIPRLNLSFYIPFRIAAIAKAAVEAVDGLEVEKVGKNGSYGYTQITGCEWFDGKSMNGIETEQDEESVKEEIRGEISPNLNTAARKYGLDINILEIEISSTPEESFEVTTQNNSQILDTYSKYCIKSIQIRLGLAEKNPLYRFGKEELVVPIKVVIDRDGECPEVKTHTCVCELEPGSSKLNNCSEKKP